MNNLLYWLNSTNLLNRRLVGDKALILSQLQQEDYGIFPGFVLSSEAFRQFMQAIDDSCSLLTDFPTSSLYINVDNPQTLQWVAQQSQQEIFATSLPPSWASNLATAIDKIDAPILILRASLTIDGDVNADFSGLLPAQICENNLQQLELSIKNLWSNLFSAKSLFYCQRIGIDLKQVNLAVLVQPLYNAVVSGIAHFQGDNLHIQATWGLGNSLLKGEIYPDIYDISLETEQIKNQQLGYKMLAYHLPANFNGLEAYLLNQDQQNNYCLDSASLSKLIQLLKNLQIKHPLANLIEWSLTAIPFSNSKLPQFYINQVSFSDHKIQTFAQDYINLTMVKSPILLQGIAASSGVVVAATYVIDNSQSFNKPFPQDIILVTQKINPEWFPLFKQIKGIITEIGGLNSHAAIIARELQIPAIVGAKDATQLLKSGTLIRLDGNTGNIYLQEEELPKTSESISEISENITQFSGFNYPIATQLMVNLSQVSSLEKTTNLPIDGIGLLRAELMLLDLLSHKSLQQLLAPDKQSYFLEQWSELITQFAQTFSPRPIFYRSLDWLILPPDHTSDLIYAHTSLQQRGTYRYCLDPTLFDLELQALARVYQNLNQINPNLKLILPFVRTVEEFQFCRQRVAAIGLTQYPNFQLWIMAEVPSVIFLLSSYVAAGVQGIAIGSNDLTQFLLGINRDQDILTAKYNATHPAMLAALKQLITEANNLNIPCSICGQAPAQYPELIDYLIRWGITSISVELDAVAPTYQGIIRAEQRLLLEMAKNQLK